MLKFKVDDSIVDIKAIDYVNLVINKVAKGTITLWELIKSCFGSGTWKSDSLWVDTELWKNN